MWFSVILWTPVLGRVVIYRGITIESVHHNFVVVAQVVFVIVSIHEEHLEKPWMTQEIKHTIRKRDSLCDKYKRLRRPTDRCAFLEANHLVKQKLKQAHNRYIEEILGLTYCIEQPVPNCQSSPGPHKSTLASKKLFSLLKYSKQDSKGIAPLNKDGKLYSDTVDKANELNQQFQSVFTPKCQLKLSLLASMAVQDLSDIHHKYQVSVLIYYTPHGKYHCLNKWHCQTLEGPESP